MKAIVITLFTLFGSAYAAEELIQSQNLSQEQEEVLQGPSDEKTSKERLQSKRTDDLIKRDPAATPGEDEGILNRKWKYLP